MNTVKTITLALMLIIFSVALTPILTPVANASENAKYRLTVNATPSDSRVRVMNIKPKYRHGIVLEPGKYDIEVTRSGYEPKRWWVEIKNADLSIDVILNKLGAKEQQVNEVISSEADDAALIQYALQLRKTKPKLFSGAQGILIIKVEPNSQAEKKGLQRGDIIVAYAKQPINSTEQLINIGEVNANKPQTDLQFIRANVVQTIVLKSGIIGVRLIDIKEEISLEQFKDEFYTAWEVHGDVEKMDQLFRDNPDTTRTFKQDLVTIWENSRNIIEQIRVSTMPPQDKTPLPDSTELREEISLEQLKDEFYTALEVHGDVEKNDTETADKITKKISQLFKNNPGTVKKFFQPYQPYLATINKSPTMVFIQANLEMFELLNH